MTNLKIGSSVIIFCFMVSCSSDSICFKCTIENGINEEREHCDGDEVLFKDQEGNKIEFDDFKNYLESVGYSCD